VGGDGGFRMALGRQGDRQAEMLVAWSEMPRSPGRVFYDRLQTELVTAEFDGALGGGGHLPGAATPPRVRDTASMVRSGKSPGHAAAARHVLAGNPVGCRTARPKPRSSRCSARLGTRSRSQPLRTASLPSGGSSGPRRQLAQSCGGTIIRLGEQAHEPRKNRALSSSAWPS
jgi:hypothetical protein